MRFKYVIEVRHNEEVEYPKSSDNIEDLKEWIWKKYPSAVKMPVLPSEYIDGWYGRADRSIPSWRNVCR